MEFKGIYKNTVILSCTTLLDYVQIAQKTCKTNFPVIELDRQYHVKSSQMRKHIFSYACRDITECRYIFPAVYA